MNRFIRGKQPIVTNLTIHDYLVAHESWIPVIIWEAGDLEWQ
jgi:hypothetical protein